MADDKNEPPVLYMPDTPSDASDGDDKRAIKDRKRRDELAADTGLGDELSGYEKVAGRGGAD